jgi:hypothetical protein
MPQEEQKTETERTGDQKPEKKQIENRKKERRIVQPSSSALPPCTRYLFFFIFSFVVT